MYGILTAAIAAALVVMAVTPAVQRWAEKIGAVDQPSARRINTRPMPRVGGIAILLGFLAAALITVTIRQISSGQHTWTREIVGLIAAVSYAGVVGLIDDLYDLSAKRQVLAIVGAGVLLYLFGVRIEGVTNLMGGSVGASYNPSLNWHALSAPVSLLATVVWVFVVTKTVDAIDGLDGLAAGVCAISAATLALMSTQLHPSDGPGLHGPTLALIAAALVGACIGFLRFNYHPARIIMGTIGAWVLGVALSAISILGAFKVAAVVSVLVPVLVLGVPIFDYIHVMIRRVLAHAPLTKADKRHLHHRLLERGWNQRQVAWFIYSLTAVLCLAAFALFKARHVLR